jgi:hypothetical protein
MIRPALTLMLVVGVIAGQDKELRQAASQRLQSMARELKLNDAQKSKILPILSEEAPKVKALREDASLSRNQKLAKLMDIKNETNTQIEPLLTADQRKKLDQLRMQDRQQAIQELKAHRGQP